MQFICLKFYKRTRDEKEPKTNKKIRFANLIFELLLEMTFTFHRNVIK